MENGKVGTEVPCPSELIGSALSDSHPLLRLFIAGNTPRSLRTVQTIRAICERHLQPGCILEIVDIYQQPDMARKEQILATPTLIKYTPLPKKFLVGDFSQTERVLASLGLS